MSREATTSVSDRVWYVSYGSNLKRKRFLTYIVGGTIEGNDYVHPGCRDKRPPLADVSLTIPHALYFAAWSENWRGTSGSFVTLDTQDPPAFARAYLVTRAQFEDVVAQENHGAPTEAITLDLQTAVRDGHSCLLASGAYNELLYCGEREGAPMVSFTASRNRTDHNKPSGTYLRMIASGLNEAHGLSANDAVAYLQGRPGVREHWTPEQLLAALDSG